MKQLMYAFVLILVACAPVNINEPQDVPRDTPQDVPQENAPVVPQTPSHEAIVEEPDAEPNPEVQELFAKASSVKSYSFQLAELPEVSGNKRYFVRDGKAKVELVSPRSMSGWSADYVFVDYEAKTAVAYCIDLRGCREDKLKAPVSFEEFGIKLPPQWLSDVQYGEKAGGLQFNNRPMSVVTWQEGSIYYEAYLDNFYGFPQRVSLASDPERETVIGGYEYQAMSFNNVAASDVVAPY